MRSTVAKYTNQKNPEANGNERNGRGGNGNKEDGENIRVLTSEGFYHNYPVWVKQGEIDSVYYAYRGSKNYPAIFSMDLKTGEKKKWAKKSGINGMTYDADSKTLYFSALEYYKSYYRFSDIYQMDMETGKPRALTKGRRLLHPVRAGDTVYCIKRQNTASYLARLDLKQQGFKKETVISKGFGAMANLSISPDKKTIAAAVKNETGKNVYESWRIALFNSEGKLIKWVTDGWRKCFSPVWKNTQGIYYIISINGKYRPAYTDLNTGKHWVYNSSDIPSLRYLDLSRDKDEGVISFFSGNGLNLAHADFSKMKIVPLMSLDSRDIFDSFPTGKEEGFTPDTYICEGVPTTELEEPFNPSVNKYNFMRDLLPKFFTPSYRDGGNEYQPGIYTWGQDVLGEHQYSLDAHYGFKTKSFNWHFNYKYDGFYPTLTFDYEGYTDLHRNMDDQEHEISGRKAQVALQYPLIFHLKRQAWFYTDIYFESLHEKWGNAAQSKMADLNGMRAAVLFNSAQEYYDSISLSDGIRFSLSYMKDTKFLGSDFNIDTYAIEYKQYLTVHRPNVLAFRFVWMDSLSKVSRVQFMGGNSRRPGYGLAGNSLFKLMRGYPAGYFKGTGGCLLNLEYRVSLFKIERPFLYARSLERVYLAVFADMGNLWEGDIAIELAISFGGELNLRLLVGDFRLNVALGVAGSHRPNVEPRFYLRIGNSF
ncbi:MAG: hypothetical protein GY765_03430 [bacterium]|nr:hypothetical protein [bacterium]